MNITVFGEVLWDVFASEKKIGGAPFNFAAHVCRLGGNAALVSAVGNDELGADALKEINRLGVDSVPVAVCDKPTGYCAVTLKNGTPEYDLVKNTAYDFIPVPQEKYFSADALYFGTLAQRGEFSRKTLKKLLSGSYGEVFFDINIRGDFYSDEIIRDSLSASTILKISREEIGVLGIKGDNETVCRELKKIYPKLKLIIVTLDCDGAFVFSCAEETFTYAKKPTVTPVSTVGAGDSFSACFLYNYLSGATAEQCLDRASNLAGFVVTQLGAIPEYPAELLSAIR